ncbi:hypothetical protein F4814DRAFT_27793 [Daldinia grandis]|nr:hypothetical protein F4814DRAFT_27793 [Daldinia grandis]
MLPVEVPEVHVALFMVALVSQSIPSHRRDAGGFANSSSHQMWSVCSLQVSLFLHLFLPVTNAFSFFSFSSLTTDRLNPLRRPIIVASFSLFPFKLGLFSRSPCRATDAMSSSTFVPHLLQGRLSIPPPPSAALGASPSRSQNLVNRSSPTNMKEDIEAMHVWYY